MNNSEQTTITEKELQKEGVYLGAVLAVGIATLFFIVQIALGEGMNYGLYAIVFANTLGISIIRFMKQRQKRDLVLLVTSAFIVVTSSILYIMDLVSKSDIF